MRASTREEMRRISSTKFERELIQSGLFGALCPTPAARRLAEASISPNTPPGLLRGAPPPSTLGSTVRPLEDATLASYLAEFHDQGQGAGEAPRPPPSPRFRGPPRRPPEPGRTGRVRSGLPGQWGSASASGAMSARGLAACGHTTTR